MSEHECKVIYEPNVLARKWAVWCYACNKIIGACQTEQDAKDVGENHVRWQTLKESFSR